MSLCSATIAPGSWCHVSQPFTPKPCLSSPVHGVPALEHRQDDMFGNLGGVSGALSFIWTWPRPAKSGLAQCRRQPGGHLAQDAEDLLAGLLPELTETKRLERRDRAGSQEKS